MFDARLRPVINPAVRLLAAGLAHFNVTANQVTVTGIILAVLAAAAIMMQVYILALTFILLNRLLDGIDGPLARLSPRHTETSAFGGYLDSVADFFFYGLVPLAFAVADPGANALPACVLLFSFILNGVCFLAFAAVAAERNLKTTAQGPKSFYYLAGLIEGFETILFFTAMTLWPAGFPMLAYVFAGLCCLGAVMRVLMARRLLN